MSTTNGDWVVQPGTDVYGSDGEKVGEVDNIENGFIVLKKGFFFPKEHYVPFSAIAGHTEDRIDLNISADQARNEDWNDGSTTTATTTRAVDDVAPVRDDANATETTTAANTGRLDDADQIRVPVVEEELTARTRGVERGQVHVETRVTETEQTLEVPVTEERVRVERVRVNRDATAEDMSTDGATIDVPVYGEEVEMDKRARVVEEVEISKEAVGETREVSGTVRREDVEVVDDTTRGTGQTRADDIDPNTGKRRRN